MTQEQKAEAILYKHILADAERQRQEPNVVSITTPPLEELRKEPFFQMHIAAMMEFSASPSPAPDNKSGDVPLFTAKELFWMATNVAEWAVTNHDEAGRQTMPEWREFYNNYFLQGGFAKVKAEQQAPEPSPAGAGLIAMIKAQTEHLSQQERNEYEPASPSPSHSLPDDEKLADWVMDGYPLTDKNLERFRIAKVVRDKIAAMQQQVTAPSPAGVGEELATLKECIAEQVEQEKSGFWRTCSGCYESEDGHAVGSYPYSNVFQCVLGSGCHECGGIGAVWDNTDYEDFAKLVLQSQPSPLREQPTEGEWREKIATEANSFSLNKDCSDDEAVGRYDGFKAGVEWLRKQVEQTIKGEINKE